LIAAANFIKISLVREITLALYQKFMTGMVNYIRAVSSSNGERVLLFSNIYRLDNADVDAVKLRFPP
jgi:hypothetical protein